MAFGGKCLPFALTVVNSLLDNLAIINQQNNDDDDNEDSEKPPSIFLAYAMRYYCKYITNVSQVDLGSLVSLVLNLLTAHYRVDLNS